MGKCCTLNYIINETNLLKETFQKEDDYFKHSMDKVEKFISKCNSPKLICDMLLLISTPKNRMQTRLYADLLINLIKIFNDYDTEKLEKYLYNSDIFMKILETLKYDIWLGEYEHIWQVLLNDENQSTIKIFNKYKYNVTQIFMNQVNNLIEKQLLEKRLTAVIRIMTLFFKVGEKVKKQYGGDNYYVNEFKEIYSKISKVIKLKNDEDYEEFENYFK